MLDSHLKKILGKDFNLISDLIEQLRTNKDRVIYLVSCVQMKYAFIDDSFQEVTGYASSELLNKGLEFWISLIHFEEKASVMEKIIEGHRMITDPDYKVKELKPLKLVYRFRKKDGQWIWLEETKWIIPTGKRVKDFILGSFLDITRQKSDEDNRLRLQVGGKEKSANGLLKLALEYMESNKKHLIDSNHPAETARNNKADLLTKREKEVLKLIGKGLSSKQISAMLFISLNTVETHRRHLLQKLEVKNSMELIKEASKSFWL